MLLLKSSPTGPNTLNLPPLSAHPLIPRLPLQAPPQPHHQALLLHLPQILPPTHPRPHRQHYPRQAKVAKRTTSPVIML